MRLPDALTPLRDRQFAWFFGGRVISIAGTVMAPVALTFAVLDLSDSASALGQVLAARTIPMVVFLLVGGVVADRFSRSTVMQVAHVLAAITQGAVALLLLTDHAELWMIIALEALNGTVSAFTFPAMQGIVPLVVPRTHIQQANALLGFSRNGLAILGPTAAAVLVVTVGSGWAIAVDAVSWAVAAAFMAKVRLPAAAEKLPGRTSTSMARDLIDGWSAFVENSWVWIVVLAFGLLNVIHIGAWYTLSPLVARETIGEQGWGLVLSAEAFGFLVMTVVLLRVRLRFPLRAGMMGVCLLALPILALGVSPHLVPLMVLAFVSGAGIEVFSIGWSTALHENIPNEVLSRVQSYDGLGSFVAIPIGQLSFGPLGVAFGPRDVLVVSAVLYAAIALATLLAPSVRNLRQPESRRDPSLDPA